MEIVWLEKALEDIENIRMYYDELEERQVANKILQKVIRSVGLLKTQPYIGKPSNKNEEVHELVIAKSTFVVPYRVVGNYVQILQVFDTRREPQDSWGKS